MKKILIIAGPNGAGKTTFAEEFLPNEAACPEFVNADLIAAGLSPFRPGRVAFTAGRLMLERINELSKAGTSFAFETTLSTRSWASHIPRWQAAGYQIKLCFFQLPDAGLAIQRVAHRVRLGGHSIPEATIRRRYERGLENLHKRYLRLVDEWAIYDGSRQPPHLLATGTKHHPDKLMEDSPTYSTDASDPKRVQPLNDPDFIGAEAAVKRASENAIARARAAGLEPVLRVPSDESED